jgi:hypothetical protein
MVMFPAPSNSLCGRTEPDFGVRRLATHRGCLHAPPNTSIRFVFAYNIPSAYERLKNILKLCDTIGSIMARRRE